MKTRGSQRIFSTDLKLELVQEIELGNLRIAEVCRMYQVSRSGVYKWLRKYSDIYKGKNRVVVEKRSMSKKAKEQQDQIKELERTVGQKQMRIDYLEKLLEEASKRLGEDIEKKIKRQS